MINLKEIANELITISHNIHREIVSQELSEDIPEGESKFYLIAISKPLSEASFYLKRKAIITG